ncbi:hypothetical protein FG93_05528 [Bosea sp. LC85]|uniref:hypothetical protein n=1 Tax=Bosea sp. LC85 TaxID=1502851 RepID=UPI0004E3A3EC|nr:hypothetical protein [Bosea sp. LC85]KFC64018.1 hypothetical protein FG93_05528 [Bosea sp. LC85]
MADLATLRRRRDEAKLALVKAELRPKKKGRGKARRRFVQATADLLQAELNHRKAAPLLRAQTRQRETADLFSQMGA